MIDDALATPLSRLARLLDRDPGSGPLVARLYHRLLGLMFLVAFLSLGAQVRELIGQRGLLPLAAFLDRARGDLSLAGFPTLFWISAGDHLLTLGLWVGALLALAALCGLRPRLSLALSTVLYLSYATACRTFTSFQWDNLLLECGALALLLPRDRRARWIHFLVRVLLFKLYFESGIAKWQSHLHDWHDGSAMTFYYETAPLPTWLGWYAHALPAWWHRVESWATLGFELLVPFAIFGPRLARRAAFVLFTAFQGVNAATANYGFFCYLAAVLHVFLLDDDDLQRAQAWVRAKLRRPSPTKQAPPARSRFRAGVGRCTALIVTPLYLAISLAEGLVHFARGDGWDGFAEAIAPLRERIEPWRLCNTYHLFGHITRERIEPEIQTFDGARWTARDLRHKAGDPLRAPGFAAPHQPRLDFQLWFYGLSFQRATPEYVATLIDRLCHDPSAVERLFAASLPAKPEAVRIAFHRYYFTTRDERRATGAWWRRELIGASRSLSCGGEESPTEP
ncbi:MAG: lipase maturation factor family protein [Myxococcales bacterium]|nr:lipase maturation factor family protein [Myxococcales bacterium]